MIICTGGEENIDMVAPIAARLAGKYLGRKHDSLLTKIVTKFIFNENINLVTIK